MLGEGYPIDCFVDKDIANELLCSICFDVARTIMSCNMCDRSFCEACITTYWFSAAQQRPQCPCCKNPWFNDDDEDDHYLQNIKGYLHRDRKCENILRGYEMMCPCKVMPYLLEQDGGASTEQVTPSPVEPPKKSRGRRKSSKGITEADEVATETQSSAAPAGCSWRGTLLDYDEHLVAHHPTITPNGAWVQHYMTLLRNTNQRDYFQRLLYVKNMITQISVDAEVQHLVKLSNANDLFGWIVEPYNHIERQQELDQNESIFHEFLDYDEERLSALFGDVSFIKTFANSALSDRMFIEFYLKHSAMFFLVPYFVELPVFSTEALQEFDQRYMGLVWFSICSRAARELDAEEFHRNVEIVGGLYTMKLIRESESCIFHLFHTCMLLEFVALETRKINCISPFQEFVLREYHLFTLVGYTVRTIAHWDINIGSFQPVFSIMHMLIQGTIESLVGNTSIFHHGHEFSLMPNMTLPLVCSVFGEKYHNVLLYSGAFRHNLCLIRAAYTDEENTHATVKEHEEAAKAAQAERERERARKAVSRRKSTTKTTPARNGRGSRSSGAHASHNVEEHNGDEDADDVGDETDESEDFLGINAWYNDPLNLDRINLTWSLFVAVRMCETLSYMEEDDYYELHKPISYTMGELVSYYAPSDYEKIADICHLLLRRTILLPSYRRINDLAVRVLFATLTMFGERESPAQFWKQVSLTSLLHFVCDHNQSRIELGAFERLLLANLIIKYENMGHPLSNQPEKLEKVLQNVPMEATEFSAARKIQHIRALREYYELQDREYESRVGIKVEEQRDEDGDVVVVVHFEPNERPYSSVTVDVERTTVYSALLAGNSNYFEAEDVEDRDPVYATTEVGYNSPELHLHIATLAHKPFDKRRMEPRMAAKLPAAKQFVKEFRTQREKQYYDKAFHGMDVLILEHVLLPTMSRYLLTDATRVKSRPKKGRGGKRRSSLKEEWEEPEDEDILCIVPVTGTSVEAHGVKSPSTTAKAKGKARGSKHSSKASHERDALRVEALREWILIHRTLGDTYSMYYDEAIVACYLLLFGVSDEPVVVVGPRVPRMKDDPPSVARLHAKTMYQTSHAPALTFVQGLETPQTTANVTSTKAATVAAFWMTAFGDAVTADMLEAFVHQLVRQVLDDDGSFRFLHKSSQILWTLLAAIMDVVQAMLALTEAAPTAPTQARSPPAPKRGASKRQKKGDASSAVTTRPRSLEDVHDSFGGLVRQMQDHVRELGFTDELQRLTLVAEGAARKLNQVSQAETGSSTGARLNKKEAASSPAIFQKNSAAQMDTTSSSSK